MKLIKKPNQNYMSRYLQGFNGLKSIMPSINKK